MTKYEIFRIQVEEEKGGGGGGGGRFIQSKRSEAGGLRARPGEVVGVEKLEGGGGGGGGKQEEGGDEEGLFKAGAVNEETSERDRAIML